MNKVELLQTLQDTVPELKGTLHIERVLYHKQENKAFIFFLCDKLVSEREFLRLENKLIELFPKVEVSLRVASPSLANHFRENIGEYKPVLVSILRRQSPAMATWIDDTAWKIDKDTITLICPDQIALDYYKRKNLDKIISQSIKNIFRLELTVNFVICNEREAWVNRMRDERDFIYPEEIIKSEKTNSTPNPSVSIEPPPSPLPVNEPVKKTFSRITPEKVLKGRNISENPMLIDGLNSDSGMIVVEGTLISVAAPKVLKGGKTILASFAVYDDTNTVYCKAFYSLTQPRSSGKEPEMLDDEEQKLVWDQVKSIKNGLRVRLRGNCAFDTFLGEISVSVRDMVVLPVKERLDEAPEKRIELHLHSSMSAMDATNSISDLIALAAKWGHSAIALTDHGNAQAFPEAFGAAKRNKIKFIPGMEGYLCDLIPIVQNPTNRSLDDEIVVFDFETTGLSPALDLIIEIGAVKLKEGQVIEEFSMLCDPGRPLSPRIVEITGITDDMLVGQESPDVGVKKLLEFIGDSPVCAHNAAFDMGMLKAACEKLGIEYTPTVLDTLLFSRRLFPSQRSHRLAAVCRNFGISLKNAHRAVHDATATAKCLAKMLDMTKKMGASFLNEVDAHIDGKSLSESYHILFLVKSQNLNHLITESNLNYFLRQPNLPRSVVTRYREGLIVGSACEAGELFQAVIKNRPDHELKKIASFYDFLEIQPIGNNLFMLEKGLARDEEQLRDFNRKIIQLGEKLNIPVVATGDVHFKNPEDAIYRSILQATLGFKDFDSQPPLYFKTTTEMLEEFDYLGKEKAYEVVISNPKLIASWVGEVSLFPKHPNNECTFQPFWEEAASTIENDTMNTAAALYGTPLPDLVTKRIKKELNSIIGYGFATLYAIAQKLVKKSESDGYMVGSRGSVGSSLVATLCGITEVNPLPPHYRCDHCHKMTLTPPELGSVGVDLPNANCEICGNPLKKDGFDIPFEVFLGFEGDKVPDIDLNFSGEYQAKAHAYVEELFGKGYVFRAGTISVLAEKTAFGFAAKYLELKEIPARKAHKERLAAGCMGVKRTTGQHPGGLVVLPKEYNIQQFTAIQHPADDITGTSITTHYDFNSMHDILVKLDCLGHDDPTILYRLASLTGIATKDVPLDDPGVMSLFISPDALSVTAEEILCPTGTLGVPEFGTSFVQGMLQDTKPTTMEELIRISGLSHGTDVWLGNAKELIDNKVAVLRECICTRDDIMNYLITMGVDSKIAFDTMESVRKGKGLNPTMEQAMIENKVPEWFILSCKKIKYMFPKGHAVAYVIMALRVAWYKLYYPLAYYSAYFSIRCDGFDAGTMLLDNDTIKVRINEIQNREGKLSPKDKQEENAYRMLLEMQSRGIKMLPVDLYKSDLIDFLPENGHLRCPFTAINGFGESAAKRFIETRDPENPYLSIEELKNRTRAGNSTLEMLRKQGALNGLSKSNQIDMFSLLNDESWG